MGVFSDLCPPQKRRILGRPELATLLTRGRDLTVRSLIDFVKIRTRQIFSSRLIGKISEQNVQSHCPMGVDDEYYLSNNKEKLQDPDPHYKKGSGSVRDTHGLHVCEGSRTSGSGSGQLPL